MMLLGYIMAGHNSVGLTKTPAEWPRPRISQHVKTVPLVCQNAGGGSLPGHPCAGAFDTCSAKAQRVPTPRTVGVYTGADGYSAAPPRPGYDLQRAHVDNGTHSTANISQALNL